MDNKVKKQVDHSSSDPHLSISAHVVVQLGKELVTDKEQSILELVKNAYDADADECEIIIDPDWSVSIKEDSVVYYSLFPERKPNDDDTKEVLDKKKKASVTEVVGRIIIKDDGDGMTDEVVNNSWLRISYSRKRPLGDGKKLASKKGRTPVGDKGLGRLATMKLGKIIRLDTSIEGELKKRGLWFSWDDFTVDKELGDVPVHIVGVEDQTPAVSKGSLISIVGLEELGEWNKPSTISKELVSRLSELVSPFLEEKGFSIGITHKNRTYEITHLNEDILNLSSSSHFWKWNGKSIHHKALINETMFYGAGTGKALEEFNRVFKNEKNRAAFLDQLLNNKKLQSYNLAQATHQGFIIADYHDHIGSELPEDRVYKNAKDPGEFSGKIYDFNFSRKIQEALNTAGATAEQLRTHGIQVFRDGFQIRIDKDWLKLSEGQTVGSSYYGLRPANTVGYFSISNSTNPKLVEKSDREGFLDNNEFRGFMLLSMRARDKENFFREYVRREYRRFLVTLENPNLEDVTPAHAIDATQKYTEEVRNELDSVIHNIESIQGNSSSNEIAAKEIENIATKLKQVSSKHNLKQANISLIKHHVEGTEDLNLRLLEAAAVGLSARSISHELHQYSRQLREVATTIKLENKTLKNSGIQKSLTLLNSTLRELTKMISSLDPMLPGSRSIKEKIEVSTFLKNYVEGRSEYAKKKNVSITVIEDYNSEYTVRFNISRLLQILENLFQNSIYWLNKYKKANLPSPKITVTVVEGGFTWEDNGPGVNLLYAETLFDPYITDKPSGEGQGLGLHISSVFLQAERCSMWLGDEKNSLGRRYKFYIDLSPSKFISKQGGLF